MTHKAGGDGQRHERQNVERVANRVMMPKVPMMANGTATHERGANFAQEDEHDQDDEHQ
jgi:hypothetical protein